MAPTPQLRFSSWPVTIPGEFAQKRRGPGCAEWHPFPPPQEPQPGIALIEAVIARLILLSIGANCVLTRGSESWSATTDGFGDFWFDNLPDGTYTLTVEANGFKKKTFDTIDTEEDSVNLGDIPLAV